jgi:hypothetical protein
MQDTQRERSPEQANFNSKTKARLLLQSELEEVPKYATLSHCWGTVKFVTLQNRNIYDFMNEIPPEVPSKTFREAIHVARELGFSCIWIDSLCIIQIMMMIEVGKLL